MPLPLVTRYSLTSLVVWSVSHFIGGPAINGWVQREGRDQTEEDGEGKGVYYIIHFWFGIALSLRLIGCVSFPFLWVTASTAS